MFRRNAICGGTDWGRGCEVSAGGFALGCSNMDTWVGTGREIEQHSVFRGAGPCLIGRMKRKGCERARDF